ncbi:iron complex transport system substrate-binding protein [Franzmannia pantelleriensis]|uniref:Iron complex transport system substrate-binding protein n=1 Tax=Franzmannia pantelleriensis TaxID=48727 RepID=A0A1G9RAN1_9GAMM|nr:ABC transporter substrate-binding protein [Halomonas pantelleriensis]SDM20211.1 iron complex transport system substrate-binding protein [Halomonas pantelleriensis]
MLVSGLGLIYATPSHAEGIASIDWTLAETLVAIDASPQGVAQVDAYHEWVGEPRLAEHVLDIGLRSQPNTELLAHLAPAHIVISPMFANLAPRLSKIGQVDTFHLYTPGRDTWEEAATLTRELGEVTGRSAAADALIAAADGHIEALRQQLPEEIRPMLIIQFMDERHVRVFGENGLFQAVLDRLGLENAWQEETNAWGFSLVGLEQLMKLDAQLVVVEPYPTGVEEKLRRSALWQHLPSVRDGTYITLPAAWSFGALPSARRFAELLVEALPAA